MANIDTNYGNSFGYQDLIGEKGSGGMGDRIAAAYQQVDDALKQIKTAGSAGNPADLVDLQMKMNSLTQVLSTTTQMVNTLKTSVEGILRNL